MEQNENHIKFGDVITIKLAKQEYFLCSPGFITEDISMKKIKETEYEDISESLFRVMPPLSFEKMQNCLDLKDKIQEQNEEYTKVKNIKLQELTQELGEHEKIRTQSNSNEISYKQDFMLQHIVSKKFLCFKEIENEQDQFTLELRLAPKKDFAFSILQFFRHRSKKENFIKYNEKILLCGTLEENRYNDYYMSINQITYANLNFRKTVEQDDILFCKDQNRITPLIFQKYEDNSIKESNFLRAGDMLIINHLASKSLVSIESREKTIIELEQQFKKQQKNIVQQSSPGKQNFQQSKSIYNQNLQNLLPKRQVNVFLEPFNVHSHTANYWIAEKQEQDQGGQILYKEPFRLKNLQSGKYLTFQEYNTNELTQLYSLTVSSSLNNDTLFYLQDEKGPEETQKTVVDYSNSFTIVKNKEQKQEESNYLIGIQFDNNNCLYQLKGMYNPIQIESFKFIKLNNNLTWELRYIKDCTKVINEGVEEIRRLTSQHIWKLRISTMQMLEKIEKALSQTFVFLFCDQCYISDVFRYKTENTQRAQLLISSYFHQSLFRLLTAILDENTLQLIQQTIQKKNRKQLLENKRNLVRMNTSYNTTIQLSLLKKLNVQVIYGQDFTQRDIINYFIKISNNCYQILSVIVNQEEFPQKLIRKYVQKFIQHVGYGLDAWECLSMLLKRLEDIQVPLKEKYKVQAKKPQKTLIQNEKRQTVLHTVFQTYTYINPPNQLTSQIIAGFIELYVVLYIDVSPQTEIYTGNTKIQYSVDKLQNKNSQMIDSSKINIQSYIDYKHQAQSSQNQDLKYELVQSQDIQNQDKMQNQNSDIQNIQNDIKFENQYQIQLQKIRSNIQELEIQNFSYNTPTVILNNNNLSNMNVVDEGTISVQNIQQQGIEHFSDDDLDNIQLEQSCQVKLKRQVSQQKSKNPLTSLSKSKSKSLTHNQSPQKSKSYASPSKDLQKTNSIKNGMDLNLSDESIKQLNTEPFEQDNNIDIKRQSGNVKQQIDEIQRKSGRKKQQTLVIHEQFIDLEFKPKEWVSLLKQYILNSDNYKITKNANNRNRFIILISLLKAVSVLINLAIIDIQFKNSNQEVELFKWMLSFLTSPDNTLNKTQSYVQKPFQNEHQNSMQQGFRQSLSKPISLMNYIVSMNKITVQMSDSLLQIKRIILGIIQKKIDHYQQHLNDDLLQKLISTNKKQNVPEMQNYHEKQQLNNESNSNDKNKCFNVFSPPKNNNNQWQQNLQILENHHQQQHIEEMDNGKIAHMNVQTKLKLRRERSLLFIQDTYVYQTNLQNYLQKTVMKYLSNSWFKSNSDKQETIFTQSFIKQLILIFSDSNDFHLNNQLLKIIYSIQNMKKCQLQQIGESQYLFNIENVNRFYRLEQYVDCLRHFQERSGSWIINDFEQDHNKELSYKINKNFTLCLQKIIQILQQSMDIKKETNIYNKKPVFQSQVSNDSKDNNLFESTALIGKDGEKLYQDPVYSIQKMLHSLKLHEVLTYFLDENLSLTIDETDKRGNNMQYAIFIRYKEVFEKTFQLLSMFVKENHENKMALLVKLPLLKKYLKVVELGQTQLIMDLYTDDYQTQIQITKDLLVYFIEQLRTRCYKYDNIDPSLLVFLEKILVYKNFSQKQILIERNSRLLLDNIFYTPRVYDFFGMSKTRKSQRFGPYIQQTRGDDYHTFDINYNEKEKLPYIYQTYSFFTCKNIFRIIKDKGRLNELIQSILHPNYIFCVLQKSDIYENINDESFLFTVFQLELITLINILWQEREHQTWNLINNQFIIEYIKNQTNIQRSMTASKIKQTAEFLKDIRNNYNKILAYQKKKQNLQNSQQFQDSQSDNQKKDTMNPNKVYRDIIEENEESNSLSNKSNSSFSEPNKKSPTSKNFMENSKEFKNNKLNNKQFKPTVDKKQVHFEEVKIEENERIFSQEDKIFSGDEEEESEKIHLKQSYEQQQNNNPIATYLEKQISKQQNLQAEQKNDNIKQEYLDEQQLQNQEITKTKLKFQQQVQPNFNNSDDNLKFYKEDISFNIKNSQENDNINVQQSKLNMKDEDDDKKSKDSNNSNSNSKQKNKMSKNTSQNQNSEQQSQNSYSNITSDDMEDELFSQTGFQSLRFDDDLYQYTLKFIEQNYSLRGVYYDYYDYRTFVFRTQLPFITNIKKFLMIQQDIRKIQREKKREYENNSKSFTMHNLSLNHKMSQDKISKEEINHPSIAQFNTSHFNTKQNPSLNQSYDSIQQDSSFHIQVNNDDDLEYDKTSESVLNDYANSFISFWENNLNENEQFIFWNKFYQEIQEFKTLFQKNKPFYNEEKKMQETMDDEQAIQKNIKQRQTAHMVQDKLKKNIKKINNFEIGSYIPNIRNILSINRGDNQRDAYRNLLLYIITNKEIQINIFKNINKVMLDQMKSGLKEETDDEQLKQRRRESQILTLDSQLQMNLKNIQKQTSISKLKTQSFLEKIITFLEVSLKYMQNDIPSIKNTIADSLYLIVNYIESFNDNIIKKQEIQKSLFNHYQLKRIIVDNLTNPVTFTNNDQVFIALLTLTCTLIKGRNIEIQKELYQRMSATSKISKLFEKINAVLEKEITKLSALQIESNKLFVMLNELSFSYEQRDQHTVLHCLSFIQWLNDEHYKDFQLFWRVQPQCNTSYDIMETIVRLFDSLTKNCINIPYTDGTDKGISSGRQVNIRMNQFHFQLMVQCLKTILSLIQGNRKENQIKLIQSSFLDNTSYCIQIFDIEQPKNRKIFKTSKQQEDTITQEQELDTLKYIGIFLHDIHSKILTYDQIIELKTLFFEIIEHLIENDAQAIIRKKIVRVFQFENLMQIMIRIYKRFLEKYKGDYSLKNAGEIEYGFQIFFLIRNLAETNKNLQKASSLFKNMQQFNKNSENFQLYDDSPEQLEDLYHFYKAYNFFERNSGWIEIINEQKQLQEVYFQILPHFHCLTLQIMLDFENLIDRTNSQTKHLSLMQCSKRFNEKMLSERRILDYSSDKILVRFLMFMGRHQPELRNLNWVVTVIENIQLIYIYKDNPSFTGHEKYSIYDTKIQDYPSIQMTLYFQITICILLFIIFIVQNLKYLTWIIKEEIKLLEKIQSQEKQEAEQLKSKGIVNQQKTIILWVEKFKIYFKNWISNVSVAYFFSYMPVLFISLFISEFFIPFLLLDVFFRFPETQNVFKAFWYPRKRLITNIILYIIFMYYFSIFAFLWLQQYFGGLCDNLWSCFSVIFDNAQKQRLSKIFATLDNYKQQDEYGGYGLDIEDVFDFTFMLIVVSCIWTWTFTSLIIESYGQLKRQATERENDLNNICFICTLNRQKINKICPYGFDKHSKNEHNRWTYLKYMASLHYKPSEQFTGTEKYIYECIQNKSAKFFPEEKSSVFKSPNDIQKII